MIPEWGSGSHKSCCHSRRVPLPECHPPTHSAAKNKKESVHISSYKLLPPNLLWQAPSYPFLQMSLYSQAKVIFSKLNYGATFLLIIIQWHLFILMIKLKLLSWSIRFYTGLSCLFYNFILFIYQSLLQFLHFSHLFDLL